MTNVPFIVRAKRMFTVFGFYNGFIDDQVNSQLMQVVESILEERTAAFQTPWSKTVAAVQTLLVQERFKEGVRSIDGIVGPRTLGALADWERFYSENGRVGSEAPTQTPTPSQRPQANAPWVFAIVIGHNPRGKGAVNTRGIAEYDENKRLAQLIKRKAEAEGMGNCIQIFERQHNARGYSAEIDTAYAPILRLNPVGVAELHFNAATPPANGCEHLYQAGNNLSRLLAEIFQRQTLGALRNRDRGLKSLSRGARGGRSVWSGQGKFPVIMTEPYFGSNNRETENFYANYDALATSTWEAIKEFGARR